MSVPQGHRRRCLKCLNDAVMQARCLFHYDELCRDALRHDDLVKRRELRRLGCSCDFDEQQGWRMLRASCRMHSR